MRGRLHWRAAMRIALQIAGALAHLSAHGITHRDVKPSNIIVSHDAHGGDGGNADANSPASATLIDLGLAREASSCDDNDDDNHVGVVGGGSEGSAAGIGGGGPVSPRTLLRVRTPAFSSIGSPAFMAPECVADARRADARSDVYGLGATLYSAVTGRLPFDGASPAGVMSQVLQGEVRPPSAVVPGLPRGVEAVLLWMLQRDARQRPCTCDDGGELVWALRALHNAPDDVTIVERAKHSTQRRRSREKMWQWLSRAAVGLVVVGSVVVAGVVLADLRPSSGSDELQQAAGEL